MKRKSLSEEDVRAAHRLKEIWNLRKSELGLTQDRAAEILGFSTQGAVSHYLNAQTPLNLEAVLKFAGLLKVAPERIRPELADMFKLVRDLTPNEFEDDIQPLIADNEQPATTSLTLSVSSYRIKRLLSETGWSQAELGRKVGVSQQAVQRWMAGKVSPNPENLDKLSEVTGHPPYWFMLPPDEGDQVVTPDTMKLGPMQLDLLKTFNAFPEEDQQEMLYEMKERKETMDKTVARWLAAQKGNKA